MKSKNRWEPRGRTEADQVLEWLTLLTLDPSFSLHLYFSMKEEWRGKTEVLAQGIREKFSVIKVTLHSQISICHENPLTAWHPLSFIIPHSFFIILHHSSSFFIILHHSSSFFIILHCKIDQQSYELSLTPKFQFDGLNFRNVLREDFKIKQAEKLKSREMKNEGC